MNPVPVVRLEGCVFDDVLLRAEEAHGQQDQLARVDLFRVGHLVELPPAGFVFGPLHQGRPDPADPAGVGIQKELFALGVVPAGIAPPPLD